MIILFIFISQLLFSDGGTPLSVIRTHYQETSQGVSCALLKHREIERQKIIREYTYLSEQDFSSDLKKVMELNYFLTNQYFLDKEYWRDEFMEVTAELELPAAFLSEVTDKNWLETYLQIDGLGFYWSARLINFPQEMTIELNRDLKTVNLKYFIYRADYCLFPNKLVRVTWFNKEDVENEVPMNETFSELLNMKQLSF